MPIPVWIRPRFANFSASAATSMSFSTARVRAQMVGQVTALEISTTELKSPGLEMGNPASMTSTPRASSARATCIFSTVLSWQPGTCSPSRSVVSKIYSLLLSLIICSPCLYFRVTYVLTLPMQGIFGLIVPGVVDYNSRSPCLWHCC